jgi:NADH-quinone oxidoreductase subunit M
MYLLYMTGKVVFGPLVEPKSHHEHGHGGHGHGGQEEAHALALPRDLNVREIATLAPLAVLCIWLGVYPAPLIHALDGPVSAISQRVDNVRQMVKTPEETPAAEVASIEAEVTK